MKENNHHIGQAIYMSLSCTMESINIDDIYNIVSGNRKRDRKLNELIQEDRLNEQNMGYVKIIREYFQDNFFINEVQINENDINNYIYFCLPQGIGPLYDEDRLIEIIDIFLNLFRFSLW